MTFYRLRSTKSDCGQDIPAFRPRTTGQLRSGLNVVNRFLALVFGP